ncbi:MAG: hypothetical protein U0228_15790 [Myxococcaceae bacterium]
MRIFFLALTLAFTAACTAQKKPAVVAPKAGLDLSAEARSAAVVDAAITDFEQRVKSRLDKGQTIRGLTRTAKQNPRFDLSPASFSRDTSSAAKLELISGKVFYTAVARADDRSAAVLEGDGKRFRIAWEITAEVSADGELRGIQVVTLGEAVAESTQLSAR